jgi:hypothetical protein
MFAFAFPAPLPAPCPPLTFLLSVFCFLLSLASASAATRYVWQDSPSPGPPHTNWTTAAHVIQHAVDAAQTGDTVLVAGGVYATGGRAVYGSMTNRVAIDRAITVESLMGPEVTIIQGYQVPGTITGDGAIRCVYLTNGASLSGFTLTNGATLWDDYRGEDSGGGMWCESTNALVSNCVVVGNSASWQGGGAVMGTLNSCTLTGNSAGYGGGGAFLGTLIDCALTGNSAYYGGGAASGTLNNCTLARNSAGRSGGGAVDSTLNNCTLITNTATSAKSRGGGTWRGMLNNCTLIGNSADWGGGANWSTLNNCVLIGNSADCGGGAASGTLNNCTVTGNSAESYGGGVATDPYLEPPFVLNNCIVYYNTAPSGENYDQRNPYSVLNYCCTTPMPTNGVGTITNAPLFVDYADGNLRLQSNSPCINAGRNAYAPGPTDLDGLPRIVSGTVDIGAYEFQGPGSAISYAWLQHYGLPTDGSADTSDSDADGHNTWQEWRCQTCPTNAGSALRLLSAQRTGTNATVTWQSVTGVSYFLECSTNLAATSCFTCVATNVLGQASTTGYTHTNAASAVPLFYRVGVGN